MQPAHLDLVITRGMTWRKPLKIMQPVYEYKPITSINTTAPLTLTVDHGLPLEDWPRERWYVRYMDDFVILHPDKQHLQALLIDLEYWLGENLQLELNNKTCVFPVATHQGRGLDFLGYHMWPHKRRLRKASLNRFKRRVRRLQAKYAESKVDFPEIRQQLSSWIAHARHGDALPAITKYLAQHTFRRNKHDAHE